MVRFSLVVLLFVMGCAGSSPDPQEVLEKSRKTTAEAEKELKAIQKSTEDMKLKIEDMKPKPAAPADLL
jgi:hypothetical protein